MTKKPTPPREPAVASERELIFSVLRERFTLQEIIDAGVFAKEPAEHIEALMKGKRQHRTLIVPVEVGRRLAKIRAVMGFPGRGQENFAQSVNISYNSWNSWETGKHLIPPREAARLTHILDGLTLDWIYLGRIRDVPLSLRRALAEAQGRD